jgi:hypothetical protein
VVTVHPLLMFHVLDLPCKGSPLPHEVEQRGLDVRTEGFSGVLLAFAHRFSVVYASSVNRRTFSSA